MKGSLTDLERGALVHIHKTRTAAGYKDQMPVRRLLELGLVLKCSGHRSWASLREHHENGAGSKALRLQSPCATAIVSARASPSSSRECKRHKFLRSL